MATYQALEFRCIYVRLLVGAALGKARWNQDLHQGSESTQASNVSLRASNARTGLLRFRFWRHKARLRAM